MSTTTVVTCDLCSKTISTMSWWVTAHTHLGEVTTFGDPRFDADLCQDCSRLALPRLIIR